MNEKLQTNFTVIPLPGQNNSRPSVTKVGILPFIPGGNGAGENWKVLLMKPRAEAKVFGPPAFQICKGTRRINISGSWCDMREEDLHYADESFHEKLLDTALREGREEIGLKPENMHKLYDLGGFTFVSASRGLVKPLHMFAAEITNPDDFEPFEATTLETRWMTPAEFATLGRVDHVRILHDMLERLIAGPYSYAPCQDMGVLAKTIG